MRLLILKLALRILKARLRRIEIELWGHQLSAGEQRDIATFEQCIQNLEQLIGE